MNRKIRMVAATGILTVLLVAAGHLAAQDAPKRDTTAAQAPDLIEVPAGPFVMGHPLGDPGPGGRQWKANEGPEHEVTLSRFSIMRDEVTVGEWVEFLELVGSFAAWHPLQPVSYNDRRWSAAVDPDEPIRAVSWYEARAYCRWRGMDLPTEAQWERAARSIDPLEPGVEPMYPWGSDDLTCLRANVSGTYSRCAEGPWPVGTAGSMGESPIGAQDMVGNVAEWVRDGYGPYGPEAVTDPEGDSDSDWRVLRGASWLEHVQRARVTSRNYAPPATRSVAVGFRCVAEVEL